MEAFFKERNLSLGSNVTRGTIGRREPKSPNSFDSWKNSSKRTRTAPKTLSWNNQQRCRSRTYCRYANTTCSNCGKHVSIYNILTFCIFWLMFCKIIVEDERGPVLKAILSITEGTRLLFSLLFFTLIFFVILYYIRIRRRLTSKFVIRKRRFWSPVPFWRRYRTIGTISVISTYCNIYNCSYITYILA